MITLVPSPLPNTFKDLERVADSVFGLVARVQIDISDGVYTKTKTWPYKGDSGEFEKLKGEDQGLPRWQELEYELDMMVQNPEEVYEEWISAGMSALIFHLESVPDTSLLQELLRNTKGRGVEAGVALRPSTPLSSLTPLLQDLDFIQCMGSDRIGEHGVSLDESVYEKIRALKEVWQGTIAVDIGVNKDTAPKLVEAGATKLALYSALFGGGDIAENVKFFQNLK